MELRSGRRLRRSSPSPQGNPSGRMDLISALPDEMLLLVLARLRCLRTAVHTSLLSRRWRGLWIGLTDLTFRGLEPYRMEALFRRYAASPQISTLDISLSSRQAVHGAADSLLRAAVPLSPGKLIFTLRDSYASNIAHIELPCFHSTTSIELDTRYYYLKALPAGEFTALQSLSITGQIINLGSLLSRCPRLRMLNVSYPEMYLFPETLPPVVGEFPALEKLSLSGRIVDPGPLLSSCERLRELSIDVTVTEWDTRQIDITPPPSGEFPVLEKLSLSGNITGLGTLLNQCPRLRVLGVTLRRMALGSLEAALTTLKEATSLGLVLSRLGIGISWSKDVDAARLASLLSAVVRLSPLELAFTENFENYNFSMCDKLVNVDLPFFPHATSIKMSLQNVCFTPLPAGEFSALDTLSLPGRCGNDDIGTMITRCPRLRVLKVILPMGKIMVHSVSLQELDVLKRDIHTECDGIDIVTPALKQLHLDVRTGRDIGVSISAPVVEKVLWHRSYTTPLALVFGSWRLQSTSIHTRDHRCSRVLCLDMCAGNHLDAELNFAQEIEKLPVTNFFMLELTFGSAWHVYGALVLQLLRMRRIRAAVKKLKVVLPWWPKAKQACIKDCPCDKPKNWRSKSIISTTLEDVEIQGYNGEDHEHDFLRLILRCSPMLKSVTVKPSETLKGCTTELSNIFLAYPSVKCYQYPTCM
ncbi:unnamed protein product [Alopecurus aequalis]